ncbi:MAG: hypothetical protein AUK48_05660 [Oscillatoriales cyanobacterium CG2_30_44_21]|nr:MAG: hypothetical protein AUK48_05660 [Oscillatoriales cyanobacterium CG2_30_44_21]
MPSNYLPPLEPIGDFRSYVCGDVVIDQTAAIASGVLIQADLGGQITIAAGVCIGMGTVIHAQEGLLEIGTGANLGAGVLVYGNSKIGDGACIGASSSIVHAVIARGAIVPPCSLISGLPQDAIEKEISPAIAQELNQSPVSAQTVPAITDADRETPIPSNMAEVSFVTPETKEKVSPESSAEDLALDSPTPPDISTLATANSAQAKAFAQSQINRFIKRLYPLN